MLDAKLVEEFTKNAALVLNIDAGKLTRDTDLKKDCNISSLIRFQIMGDMEDVLGVRVSYPEMRQCETFGQILDLAEKNKK